MIGQITSGKIHGVDLRKCNYHVQVGECCNDDAKLIYPIGDEISLVRDAVGHYVEWPSHLIIPYDLDLVRH